ncbi:MAG: restriction endonuclease subunit S [Bacteroidota bacterium]
MTNENREGYKKTKLGWIPMEWEVSNVGEAFKICNNSRKPISGTLRKNMQGKYPYYGPTKIQDYINEYQYDGRYALIAEDGDHFLKYSDKPMTQLAIGKFNVNNHAHAIQGQDKTTTEWFYWFFYHRNIFSHLTRQGAGRYKLNKASLMKLSVVIPPIPEQQKIATILSTWDKAISKTQQLIEAKEEQNKGLMQCLLTGKVRLEGFGGAWEEKKFKEIFEKKNYKSIQLNKKQYLLFGKNPIVDQGKEVICGFSNTENIIIDVPTIIFGDHTRVVKWIDFKFVPGADGTQIFKTKPIVKLKFGYYVLDFLEIPNLGYSRHMRILKNSVFNIPKNIEEQTAIAAILTKADEEIHLLQQKLAALRKQKKGLMQQLMTGKIRVKTIN